MSQVLFLVVTVGVLPFWLLLILAPRWRWTERAVQSLLVPLLLVFAYGAAQAIDPNTSPDAGFHSLPAVVALFSTPEAILAAWIHFVVVDLFVGAWEVRDAQQQGIPHGYVVPCLVLTFMMAPIGIAAYGVVRLLKARSLSLVAG